MSAIRTGVVGFGLAGRVFHAPFIAAVPALELAAIVQRTGNSASLAYPGAAPLRTLDDLLATDVELVVIATPNRTHFPFVRQALLAGKHVVCDKPLATTLAETEELAALAQQAGRLLFPFHNRRWDGDFLSVRSLLAAGTLGRVATFSSRFDRFRPQPRSNSWREDADGGGDLLQDLGPHVIDQALALFGMPATLSASLRTERTGSKVIDAFDLVLSFAGPQGHTLRAELGGSMLAAEAAPRFRIGGSLGSYVKYGLDPQEPALRDGGASVPLLGSATPWLAEPKSAWGTLTVAPDPADPAAKVVTRLPTQPGDYRGFYANVAAAIRGQAAPATTAQDAVRVARVLSAAVESSHSGCAVALQGKDW